MAGETERMGITTKIAWCDSSFNPWIGCTRKSDACLHCYAEIMNKRWKWNGGTWGPRAPRKISAESNWNEPLNWDAQAANGVRGKDSEHWLVFAGDLCDIFDREGSAEARERMWELFRRTPHLTWLMLTKRPENFSRFLPADWGRKGYANVWLGVTSENRKEAGRRIGILRKTPARLRFVSFEPLLEDLPDLNLTGIHWAIVGGESGAQARPFDLAWARSIQAQCAKSGTSFFLKQLGVKPIEDGVMFPIRHRKENDKLDANGTMLKNFPKDLRVQCWPRLSRSERST
jgi:protein gp37